VLPFDSRELRAAGFDEIRRWIREVDPPKPSTRLGSLPGKSSSRAAKNRRSEPGTLTRQIRGDLDWITMKALEKDRTRRYDSASELAMDLGRYLRDEPVSAGPPGGLYRARKFVKRHRVGVAIAALLAMVLIGFSSITTVHARRIAREATTAEQVTSFLVELFQISSPGEARGNSITAREILDRGAEKIDSELTDQPEVRARLLFTLGSVYRTLEIFAPAEALLERSLELRRELLGIEHPASIAALLAVAGLRDDLRRYEQAEELSREGLELLRRTRGDRHPDTLRAMGMVGDTLRHLDRLEEAESLTATALETAREIGGDDDPLTLHLEGRLAELYWKHLNRYPEAEEIYRRHLEIKRRTLGHDHPAVLSLTLSLALTLSEMGRLDEAEELQLGAADTLRRVLGEDHSKTLANATSLARWYKVRGRHREAAEMFSGALERMRARYGDEHRSTLATMVDLGNVYRRMRRFKEAERLLAAAVSVYGRQNPGGLWLSMRADLATLYREMGRIAEAEKLYREVLALQEADPGPLRLGCGLTMMKLGLLLMDEGRLEEAAPLMLESAEIQQNGFPAGHPYIAFALSKLGSLHALRGDRARALEELNRAVEAGFADANALAQDPQLASLHGAEFDALLDRLRRSENGAAGEAP